MMNRFSDADEFFGSQVIAKGLQSIHDIANHPHKLGSIMDARFARTRVVSLLGNERGRLSIDGDLK